MKRSSKKDRTVDPFKIWFGNVGTIAWLFESPFEKVAFHTSVQANKLPNTEIVFYIVWLGKINNVLELLFQVIQMLKMNTIKDWTKQDRTIESFNIWCRNDGTNARLF